MSNLVLPEVIGQKIYLIRGHKVMQAHILLSFMRLRRVL